jgi:hypothetical protein
MKKVLVRYEALIEVLVEDDDNLEDPFVAVEVFFGYNDEPSEMLNIDVKRCEVGGTDVLRR